jgi:hypothetical protein
VEQFPTGEDDVGIKQVQDDVDGRLKAMAAMAMGSFGPEAVGLLMKASERQKRLSKIPPQARTGARSGGGGSGGDRLVGKGISVSAGQRGDDVVEN